MVCLNPEDTTIHTQPFIDGSGALLLMLGLGSRNGLRTLSSPPHATLSDLQLPVVEELLDRQCELGTEIGWRLYGT